ncbi:MAG: type VI secretion system-associated protein TagF [Rubrivivax sp.]
MQTGEVTGWYGKLPSLGDFASRRLGPGFIEAWDEWLAAGLADWRVREPAAWLDHYLAGPSWRFVLMPGVLPGERHAWAGVLMPSVDNVGRYFPLTLAQPLPHLPVTAPQARALLDWLQRLDDLAVDSLHDDWSVEQLEGALQRLGSWQQEPVPPHERTTGLVPGQFDQSTLELRTEADVLTLLGDVAREQLLTKLQGRALWLRSDDQGRPVLRITTGLPRACDFSALLTSVDASTTPAPP